MGLLKKKEFKGQSVKEVKAPEAKRTLQVVSASGTQSKAKKRNWPVRHPQVMHFCDMLIHRYLTEGERSWLFLSDGDRASMKLQVLVASVVHTLVSQVFERIAIVMLDPMPECVLDGFFNAHPFDMERVPYDKLMDIPIGERLSQVGYWKVSEEVERKSDSIAEARDIYLKLIDEYDFVIAFASTLGQEQGGYHDPLRLQVVRNIDRVYWGVELGQSRARNLQKQLDLVNFLGIPVGEGVLLENEWFTHSWNRMSGGSDSKKMNFEIDTLNDMFISRLTKSFKGTIENTLSSWRK